MEVIFLTVLMGAVAYFILRRTTKRGTNTVRAYLYLRAINERASVREANEIAHVDLTSGLHHLSIPKAIEYVRTEYGGKQLPMIEEAIKLGLTLNGAMSHVRTKVPPASRNSIQTTSHSFTNFDAYEAIVIDEVKFLSGKASTDLHWIELTDDNERREAFADGVEPKALARAFHKHAKPPQI